ncbi:MAG: helix-turn-helix transcriptional regulator [Bacteroidetes bacterium]|nr:helix-turn-helix transcriptional regulator [Bacteroidota bacterium]
MERNIQLNWGLLVQEAIRRRKERKISQRRLAAIVEISQPTVSRFERQQKDIQLSSAIKILDALGMIETLPHQ